MVMCFLNTEQTLEYSGSMQIFTRDKLFTVKLAGATLLTSAATVLVKLTMEFFLQEGRFPK